MKRFLMLVGVAVVAAVMYVAASPASQQSAGPTAKQFNALKKQVTRLNKKLKLTKAHADAAYAFIGGCLATSNAGALPINQFGDSAGAFGFQFNDGTNPIFNTTALDVDQSTPFQGVYVQAVDPLCVQSALRHRASHAGSGLPLHVERVR